MIELSETLCSCDTCPGTECTCGCRPALEDTACACSELCACGVGCDCANCAGGSK